MKYWHRFHISLIQIGSLMAQHKASLLLELFYFLYHFSRISMLHHHFLRHFITFQTPKLNAQLSPKSIPPSQLFQLLSHPRHRILHIHIIRPSNLMIVPHQIRMRLAQVHIQLTRGHIRLAWRTVAVICLLHTAGELALLTQESIIQVSGAAFSAPANKEVAQWLERARMRLTALGGLPYPGVQHRTFHTAAGLLRRTLFGKGSLHWVLVQSLRSPSWRSS